MGVAFVGTMFALMEYFRIKHNGKLNGGNEEDEEVVFEDGI